MEVEERGLALVRASPNLHAALSLLVDWPAHALAADPILGSCEPALAAPVVLYVMVVDPVVPAQVEFLYVRVLL